MCPDFSTLMKIRLVQHLQKDHKIEGGNIDDHVYEGPAGTTEKRKPNGKKRPEMVVAEITIDDDDDGSVVVEEGMPIPGKDKDAHNEIFSSVKIESDKIESDKTTGSRDIRSEESCSCDGSKCEFCSSVNTKPVQTSFAAEDVAAEHDKNAVNIFECDACWFASESSDELSAHHAAEHESFDAAFKMKCLICSFSTLKVQEMVDHFGKNGHFSPGKTVTCTHCSYTSTSANQLISHGKDHFKAFSLAKYFCLKCVFVGNSIATMDSHWTLFHLRNK